MRKTIARYFSSGCMFGVIDVNTDYDLKGNLPET